MRVSRPNINWDTEKHLPQESKIHKTPENYTTAPWVKHFKEVHGVYKIIIHDKYFKNRDKVVSITEANHDEYLQRNIIPYNKGIMRNQQWRCCHG